MRSLTFTLRLLAILGAATASFAACGAHTDRVTASGGMSGSAGAAATKAGAGASSGGSSNNGGQVGSSCREKDCGPGLGIPNTPCADGSLGGPTGRCVRLERGDCDWEVRSCPAAGDGGAAGAGGAVASAGAATAGGGSGNAGAAGAGGATASDRCGGCNYDGPTPQICILQRGGPGPANFVCATQNPCGAAGACACIVGQGTCNSMLEGGSPGYCACDNGLD